MDSLCGAHCGRSCEEARLSPRDARHGEPPGAQPEVLRPFLPESGYVAAEVHEPNDLLLALEKGRSPILLTERTEHLEYFAARLKNFAKNVIVLRGGMGRRQREEVAQRLAAVPISWRGTLQQYAGRLHRAHAGKRVVQIYDYVDEQVPVLGRMYRKRLRGYRAMGYAVTEADPFTASSRSEKASSVR